MTDCAICFETLDRDIYTTTCCKQTIHKTCVKKCHDTFNRCPMCNKPNMMGKIYNDACRQLRQGYIHKAKMLFKSISNGDENDMYYIDSCYKLGLIYFYQGKYNKSQQSLLKCLYLCSEDDENILLLYAHTFFMTGDYHSARFIYNHLAHKSHKIYQIMLATKFPRLSTNIRKEGLTSLLHILLHEPDITSLRKCLYMYYTSLQYKETNDTLYKRWMRRVTYLLEEMWEFTLEEEIELLVHFGYTSIDMGEILDGFEINNNNICCY